MVFRQVIFFYGHSMSFTKSFMKFSQSVVLEFLKVVNFTIHLVEFPKCKFVTKLHRVSH